MKHFLPTIAALPLLAGCVVAVDNRPAPPPTPASSAPAVPKTLQWLHGSGEAAILSRQAYRQMVRFVLAADAARKQGKPVDGAVLVTGATPDAPRWAQCGAKPAAIVLDMDETAILNTGANYDGATRPDAGFDAARWDAWEKGGAPYVEPVPGAREALAQVRAAGITPIFISNRLSANATGAIDALATAGLGPAVHDQTLFLRNDVAPGSGKDPRRQAVAARWCVLAMMGDQLGDFSDAFNTPTLSVQGRRTLAQSPAVAAKWGAGWFLLPNPVYGSGVAGTLDDLFPADKRWSGPSETH
ncbi:HAD family acid phosphatase [uncultured Sphingomonas sp.]|uniref:HAD family acid phosphatase n=1 Tax=uncultured Sphingomonas sp. TaxID=158754 RepID=UPI0025D2B60C|nr:HAD family acid phosphatase [uncultured Sphingomonas sp.]